MDQTQPLEAKRPDSETESFPPSERKASSKGATERCTRFSFAPSAADEATASVRSFAQEQQQHDHEQAKRWCLRLGITSTGCEQWAGIHENPLVAAGYYYFSSVGVQIATVSLLSGMLDFRSPYIYVGTLTLFLYFLCTEPLKLVVVRHGPALVDHKLYSFGKFVSTALLLPSILLGFLGPIGAVPFHNRFYFICLVSFGGFCASHVMTAGASKGDHPVRPRTSIFRPFVRGSIRAVQVVDSLTDVAVIRTLLEQKSRGCWWFGDEGNCQAWMWLTGSFGICASAKFFLTIAVMMSGGETSSQSQRMQRLVFASEVGGMVCEMGVAVCTLLQIFSLKASGSVSGMDRSTLRSQMALGIVSLIVTCAMLVIMLMGATLVLQIMYTVWNTVIPSSISAKFASNASMAFEGRSKVTPVGDAGLEKLLVEKDVSEQNMNDGQDCQTQAE